MSPEALGLVCCKGGGWEHNGTMLFVALGCLWLWYHWKVLFCVWSTSKFTYRKHWNISHWSTLSSECSLANWAGSFDERRLLNLWSFGALQHWWTTPRLDAFLSLCLTAIGSCQDFPVEVAFLLWRFMYTMGIDGRDALFSFMFLATVRDKHSCLPGERKTALSRAYSFCELMSITSYSSVRFEHFGWHNGSRQFAVKQNI